MYWGSVPAWALMRSPNRERIVIGMFWNAYISITDYEALDMPNVVGYGAIRLNTNFDCMCGS